MRFWKRRKSKPKLTAEEWAVAYGALLSAQQSGSEAAYRAAQVRSQSVLDKAYRRHEGQASLTEFADALDASVGECLAAANTITLTYGE